MSEALARLAIDLTANTVVFESDLGRANRLAGVAARKLEADFKRIGVAVGAYLAAGLAVVSTGVKRQIDEMDRLKDSSAIIGITAEKLSVLKVAADLGGSSAEGMEKGLAKLARTMADAAGGGKASSDAFKAVGVSATDAQGKLRPVDEVFVDLSEKFKGYKSGAGEVALANAFFGKSGQKLLPVLNDGKAGIEGMTQSARDLGGEISTNAAVQADAFNDNLGLLKVGVEGVFNGIAEDLLPSLVQLSGQAVQGAKDAHAMGDGTNILSTSLKVVAAAGIIAKNVVEGIVDVVLFGVDVVKTAGAGWDIFANSLKTVASAQVAFLSGDLKGALSALRQGSAQSEQISADALANLSASWSALKSGFAGNGQDVAAAIDALFDPLKKLAPVANAAADAVGQIEAPVVDVGVAATKTADKIKPLKDRTKELATETARYRDQMLDLEADLKGPLAAANRQLEKQLEDLAKGYEAGTISAKDVIRQQKNLIESHKKTADAIKGQLTQSEAFLLDLEDEIKLIGLSNKDREREIALRQLGADATKEQVAAMDELLARGNRKVQAAEQTQKWLDTWSAATDELTGLMQGVFSGQGFSESVQNAAKGLTSGLAGNMSAAIKKGMRDGFSKENVKDVALGAIAVIGEAIGGQLGKTLNYAALGASIGGSTGNGYAAAAGAAIGIILSLVGKSPLLRVSGMTDPHTENSGRSQLGNIFTDSDKTGINQRQLIAGIAAFDNAVAGIFNPAELELARTAMGNFYTLLKDGAVDVGQIMSNRLNAIIVAVEPAFAGFLGQIADLNERLAQFVALRTLRSSIDEFATTIDSLSTDPLVRLRAELHNLDKSVTDTSDQLAAAINRQDPAAIVAAAAAAQQAIIRRYQAEVEAIRTLQAAIKSLDDQARAFRDGIQQRLIELGGPRQPQLDQLNGDINTFQNRVLNSTDTEQALADLDKFVAAVDAWLQAARADVEAWAAEARNAVNASLSALDTEQSGIMAAAQARADAANASAQAASAAQQAAQQAILNALQQQLQEAQAWVGVLQTAQKFLDQMRFTASSPLPGLVRLGALDARIQELRDRLAGAGAGDRAGIAGELLAALQERLTAAQGQFQRPSPEYLAIFNATQRETAGLRDIAQAEADRAKALQERIAALQQMTVDATSNVSSVLEFLSADDRARLDQIEIERKALQAQLIAIEDEAKRRLGEINDAARAHYLWAQTQGETLTALRHHDLMYALNEITGGLDPDAYIAQKLTETTTRLGEIRDSIVAFLAAISFGSPPPNTGTVPGSVIPGGGGGGGGNGPGGVFHPHSVGGGNVVQLTIPVELDGQMLGHAVTQIVISRAGVIATPLKRAMRAA